MKLVNIINNISDSLFTKYDWSVDDDSLLNFEKISISVSVPETSFFGIDVDQQIISVIRSQIIESVYRKIIDKLFDTDKFDYIDLRSITSNMHTSLISSKLSMFDFSNLITNANVASYLQDSRDFYISGQLNNKNIVYNKIGAIHNMDVLTDPYLNFNDNIICLFDRVKVNVKNIVASEFAGTSLQSVINRISVNFDLDFNVGDSIVLYVIYDNGKVFKDWSSRSKALDRDIKINDILS